VATDEPLAFRVVCGGLFAAASSYFNIGFGFLANLVLTRLLAPEAFGTFALAMFFFTLLNLQSKIGDRARASWQKGGLRSTGRA